MSALQHVPNQPVKKLEVTVKSLDGQAEIFEIERSQTVSGLKCLIQERLGIEPSTQQLVLGEHMVEDDTAKLDSLKGDGSIFTLLVVEPKIAKLSHSWEAWEAISGLEHTKNILSEMVIYPFEFPERFEKFGIHPCRRVLLYGPPGCGKAMLAKALANGDSANLVSMKGSELFNEANVQEVFQKARSRAPCVLFLDDLDCIGAGRGPRSRRQDAGGVGDRDMSTLPDKLAREAILKSAVCKSPIASNVSLAYLAELTEGFSDGDLVGMCQLAANAAFRDADDFPFETIIDARHFEDAIGDSKNSMASLQNAKACAWQWYHQGGVHAAKWSHFRGLRVCAPSIPSVQGYADSGGASAGALGQLLIEIDGMKAWREDVFLVGATARPDFLDDDLLVGGCFNQNFWIPFPDLPARETIFQRTLGESQIASNVSLRFLAELTEGFSGADVAELCQHAATVAREDADGTCEIRQKHFEEVLCGSQGSIQWPDCQSRYFASSVDSDDDLYA